MASVNNGDQEEEDMVSKQGKYMTLDRFLVQRQLNQPGASGELTRVLVQLGVVAKIISSHVKRSTLEGLKGLTGETNVQGEEVKKLDKLGNEAFVEAFEYVGIVGAIVSEEMDEPKVLHSDKDREKYVVLIDPIDGSSNLEVDCVIGSIFSVRELGDSIEGSVFQEGTKQTAAGYIMYGTSVIIVYSAGDGVHSFVLDEEIGEFVLDHEEIRMPDQGNIISANFGNRNHWTDPPRAFSESLMAGDQHRYSLRYSGALVADLHQILHHGGIYFYPEDDKRPNGKLRLLYECAPLAMIAEQAGGGCTTGKRRVMGITPDSLHQRVPFAIGSSYEIGKYEESYRARESA
jgi:fructose-1,6-bisphosphatase I